MVYKEDIYKIKNSSTAFSYYTNLGYKNIDGYFMVKAKDLSPHSCVQEKRKCDVCGKDYYKRHEQHELTNKRWEKDVCPICFKLPEFKQEVKKRIQKTTLDKYDGIGFGSKIINEKVKQNNLQRYGGHPSQNSEIKGKTLKIIQERYGGRSPLSDPKVKEKAIKTLYQKGDIPLSVPQQQVFEQIKRLFPESHCELNYPFFNLSLDINCILNEIKIDIEYDGKYWHQNQQKDRGRDEFVKSRRLIPSDEEIKNKIEEILISEHSYFELILKDG